MLCSSHFGFLLLFMVWKELNVIFFSCFRRERQNTVLLNCSYSFSILSDFCCCCILCGRAIRQVSPRSLVSLREVTCFPSYWAETTNAPLALRRVKEAGLSGQQGNRCRTPSTDCSIIELIVSTMVVFPDNDVRPESGSWFRHGESVSSSCLSEYQDQSRCGYPSQRHSVPVHSSSR